MEEAAKNAGIHEVIMRLPQGYQTVIGEKDAYAINNEKKKALWLRCLTEAKSSLHGISGEFSSSKGAVLEVKELTLSYRDQIIQENLCFEASAGEIIGIVGSNGAGKTTFLRAVSGLGAVKRGVIRMNGKKTSRRQRRNLCGMVMQDVNYRLFSFHLDHFKMLFYSFNRQFCTWTGLILLVSL